MGSMDGQTVLVTGGGGFIGSALVEHLVDSGPTTVRVFDNDEQRLFATRQRLGARREDLEFVVGDLRDRDRVAEAVRGVDTVFHAGAMKHVGFGEYNPAQTVATNVRGTRNLLRAAGAEGVDALTAVSTDKASNPTSVMGATKLIMERLVAAANVRAGTDGMSLNCVRFGNVLGSPGSVVPVFLDQVRQGGPLTVTDPDMTRFLMSVDRAVELILKGNDRGADGEVVVLKMPAFRLGDLVEAIVETWAPRYGYDPADVPIDYVGRRPGERVHEKLVSRDEIPKAREYEDMFVIVPETDDREVENTLDGEYTSADADRLSKAELVEMIEDVAIAAGPGTRRSAGRADAGRSEDASVPR